MYDNLVYFDVLNKNKFWIDNFKNYKNGERTIYFAIRKAINSLDVDSNTVSTYEQVGKYQWKYIDLLVYKLNVNIVDSLFTILIFIDKKSIG